MKVFNGQVYQSPSGIRVSIIFTKRKFSLLDVGIGNINDSLLNAPMTITEKNGEWLYSQEELAERINGWKLLPMKLDIIPTTP